MVQYVHRTCGSFFTHLPFALSNLVNSLGLPIPLGVGWGRISIRNSQFATVPPKGLTMELKTIVRDEGVRDPESDNNVFPDELFDIHIFDIR